VQHLPLQVAEFDYIAVHDPQAADTRGRQVQGGRGAQSAGAHQEDRGALHPVLSLGSDLRQDDLSMVAERFFWSQGHRLPFVLVHFT